MEKTETYNSYMQGSNRHRRGFMGTTNRLYNFNNSQVHSASITNQNNKVNDSMVSEFDQSVSVGYVGPNLTTLELETRFKNFIRSFIPKEVADEDFSDMSYYMRKLKQIKETDQYFVVINAQHLLEFQENLYWQLITFPADIIACFDKSLNDIYKDYFLNDHERVTFDKSIYTQIVNLLEISKVRDLKPDNINRLIAIKGIVIRTSDIYPEMKEAVFRCATCGFKKESMIERGRVDEPLICTRCQQRYSFSIEHNLCYFSDKQFIKLQETPEQVPEGETPIHVNLIIYDDMADSCKPGGLGRGHGGLPSPAGPGVSQQAGPQLHFQELRRRRLCLLPPPKQDRHRQRKPAGL